MLTSRQQKICDRYSRIGSNGKARCDECPLVIDSKALLCKAVATYDRNTGEYILDDEYRESDS